MAAGPVPGDDRIAAVLASELAMAELTPAEQLEFNTRLDAAIARAAAVVSLGEDVPARGLPAVVLDEAGNVVRIDPDGATEPP